MPRYKNLVSLEINGATFDDFKSVTEQEREVGMRVDLMHKSGSAAKTPRINIVINTVEPLDAPAFDFAGLSDATITKIYEDGSRITYRGCRTLTIGEETIDGENEPVIPVTLMAEARIKE